MAGDHPRHLDRAGGGLDRHLGNPGAPDHAFRTILGLATHLGRGKAAAAQQAVARRGGVIHGSLLDHLARQLAAARVGQVPQAPVNRILAGGQRAFMPQAFAGEDLGRVQLVDAGVQQGMRRRLRPYRAIAQHRGMATGRRRPGPRQQARQAGPHGPGLRRAQDRPRRQVRCAQGQRGRQRRAAGHAHRPRHRLGQQRRFGGGIQQIERMRRVRGRGRALRPCRHGHRVLGPVEQGRQLAPCQGMQRGRVRWQPQRQAAFQAPGRDPRASRSRGRPPEIFRFIRRRRAGAFGQAFLRRPAPATPRGRETGQGLPRVQRRHRHHTGEVFPPHHRHHARLRPRLVQAHAVERAAAITAAVPGGFGRAQRQPVQQLGGRRDGERRGLGQPRAHAPAPSGPHGRAAARNCTARSAACMISTCVPQRHRL
ncbi:Uncharacterised protein [Achromobacter xylosoxidans]|nr:Uncharacterised protein [Achromobacter xylosoxidans]